MCFGFVCCAGLLFLMFQKADARNMMPHWRNFQSWLKFLINFIQYLELVFSNKFEFSIMALNIDTNFVFIVFFIVFFFVFEQYHYIKLYQLYFNNNENKKTVCVLTIAMICSNLTSFRKFQYFRRSIYNPVKHLWWSLYCENNETLSIFTKKLHHRCLLGF